MRFGIPRQYRPTYDADDTSLCCGLGNCPVREANANLSNVTRRRIDASYHSLVITFKEDSNEREGLDHYVELRRRQPLPQSGKGHGEPDRPRVVEEKGGDGRRTMESNGGGLAGDADTDRPPAQDMTLLLYCTSSAKGDGRINCRQSPVLHASDQLLQDLQFAAAEFCARPNQVRGNRVLR
jgi:hypothetical protein